MPLPPNSEVSNGDVHVLQYNANWINSAFKSRATAEALLSPERESGNLTTRDYDAAIQFLPGTHHYYPTIGLAVGAALGMAIRSPHRGKQVFIILATALTGRTVGKLRQLQVQADYLHDIENPDGYKRAMENVQKGLGLPVPRERIVLRRLYKISPDDAFPQPTSEHVGIPSESSPSLDSSSTERSQSKWDQIRAVNSRTTQNSAWDALRQQHEKARVKPKSQDRDNDKWNTSEG